MKFMIGVDMEGIACAVGVPDQPFGSGPNFEMTQKQVINEINAAAAALFDSGAAEVYVWDNHGGSLNFNYEKIDERCSIIAGTGFWHRWPGLDNSFTGVLLLGYHPMDNTENGILCHTFSSISYQWVKINGEEVGEIAIDAAMANEVAGVPVIFVSSDYQGAAEAKRFLPWAEAVFTKTGLGRNIAICKHPVRAAREIYEGVRKAVSRIDEMKTFSFKSPIVQQTRFKRMESVQRAVQDPQKRAVFVDPYTVERTADKLSELY